MRLTLNDLIELVAEIKSLEEDAYEQGFAMGATGHKPGRWVSDKEYWEDPNAQVYPVNAEQPRVTTIREFEDHHDAGF